MESIPESVMFDELNYTSKSYGMLFESVESEQNINIELYFKNLERYFSASEWGDFGKGTLVRISLTYGTSGGLCTGLEA